MIKFTQLTDRLEYPPKIKGELSTLHSSVVTYVINNFKNVNSFKRNVISTINTISYYLIEGDSLPSDWSIETPLDSIDVIDSSVCESTLGKLFVKFRDISWDIEEVEVVEEVSKSTVEPVTLPDPFKVSEKIETSSKAKNTPTPKEHLYMKPPTIPQFDFNRPWLNQIANGVQYTIFTSLPEIPIIQNQVSVTTDVTRMTASDFMKLYPNHHIKTRPALMYDLHKDLKFDSDLGVIIPIKGFSPKQVRDNIVKYPHWFKLCRIVDGNIVNFYQNIEIDGELQDTLQIWDSLPESKVIPKSSEFIREYVVRRYLLERDIRGIKHNHPMYGDLEPFLILFTTAQEYKKLGYPDIAEYGKQCVMSRVAYKRSRNPIIKAVMEVQSDE
jgi:hypothetical protein